ncbi:glycine/betaine ABC transporter substrate-binding protein, partial [Lactobacillus reuteri]|nr:glycine/betaine ABC transporter substrate-binding protein [Limosilactobacillus reuteri]
MRFKKIVALSLLSIAGLLAGTITPAVASAASNKPII